MPLENGNFISDLVATNPTGTDPLAFADDHLRLVKGTLKNTFPNISGAVTRTHGDINNLATQANLTALETSLNTAIASAITTTRNSIYPVGSIYVNATNGTNPATLLGFGTWVEFGVGRVMVGQDTSLVAFNTLEETGGSRNAVVVEHNHPASMTSAGNHRHSAGNGGTFLTTAGGGSFGGGGSFSDSVETLNAGAHTHDITVFNPVGASTGIDANLQPYIVVKMWKRTA